jgi:hypothetical protein
MHEFEVGSQGEPATIQVDSYSGTLTATKFVNAELRHSLPAAKISVNNGARFEMGHDITASTKELVFGEVEIGAGGVLEIGHEDTLASTTGHQVGHLRVTKSGGRSGNLSLTPTSKTVVQVSGTAANQFDTAAVEGNITLAGNLEVWFNPDSTDTDPEPYVPALNDTFVIMTLATPTLPGDFTNNNIVDGGDFSTWKTAFGETANADADADGDSDGADFLAWQRDFGKSVSLGTISGNFADVVSPTEIMGAWPVGLDFTTEVVGNEVRLRVISVPPSLPLAAVPEPATVWLAGLSLIGLAARRRATA